MLIHRKNPPEEGPPPSSEEVLNVKPVKVSLLHLMFRHLHAHTVDCCQRLMQRGQCTLQEIHHNGILAPQLALIVTNHAPTINSKCLLDATKCMPDVSGKTTNSPPKMFG